MSDTQENVMSQLEARLKTTTQELQSLQDGEVSKGLLSTGTLTLSGPTVTVNSATLIKINNSALTLTRDGLEKLVNLKVNSSISVGAEAKIILEDPSIPSGRHELTGPFDTTYEALAQQFNAMCNPPQQHISKP